MSGRRLSVILFFALAAPLLSARTEDEPGAPFFVRGSDWKQTLLQSRARYLERNADVKADLGPWYATAPLPAAGFADALFPEQGVDLAATDLSGRSLWNERPEWRDGVIHDLPQLDRASTYLFRTITATATTTLTASLGSDDGIEVWLNGKLLLSKDVPRAPAADQDQVTLELLQGPNRLLLKIHNNAGGHGFYFRLPGNPLLGLWSAVRAQHPRECEWIERDLPDGSHLDWFRDTDHGAVGRRLIAAVREQSGIQAGDILAALPTSTVSAPVHSDPLWLNAYESLCSLREKLVELEAIDLPALRRTLSDLRNSQPDSDAALQLTALEAWELHAPDLRQTLLSGNTEALRTALVEVDRLASFRRQALLANPLLDFERIVYVRRRADSPQLGLPQNWQGNCSLPRQGYDDELRTLSLKQAAGTQQTLFRPEQPRMIADVDLHWDGDRLLFSMLGTHDRWQIFELASDGSQLRQVTAGEFPDVDNYDACYLPDGRILFDSTRCFQGIPCVGGADAVANLFLLDETDGRIRQLCFDQDHNWCPTVLNNGRVLFTRWEYSDTPHYFTRLLMHMDPDGTGQMEYYGSNSYWPNSIFYARPVPDHPSQVVGIVSGHHGVPRMGELMLFDPALGRHEADGVVQRIPGYGQPVEPIIADQLVDQSWPRFLHPYPLSSKYFLVACQPNPRSAWGIYLADVFDNLLLLAEEPGQALLEPIPLRQTKRPPVIPDKVQLEQRTATVLLSDIYRGPGLRDVPRGTVKKLRVYSFHYGYNQMGGHAQVGYEGPWDVHRLLGTVPVHADGSAGFTVPANTPIAIQPLDEEGKAVQLMRSWFTAMPGEVLACVGCHEPQNTTAPVRPSLAIRMPPSEIEPWRGPARGFSFTREVQPTQ